MSSFDKFYAELNKAVLENKLVKKLLGRQEGVQDNLLYLEIENDNDDTLDHVQAILFCAEGFGISNDLDHLKVTLYSPQSSHTDLSLDYIKSISYTEEAFRRGYAPPSNILLGWVLLDKGTGGDTALNKALIADNKDIVKAIFSKLFHERNLSILEKALLVNNDYDVSPLHNLILVSAEFFQEVLELARDKDELEALVMSEAGLISKAGKSTALETLLMPEAGKSTALHFAAYEEKIEIIAKILEESGKVAGLQKSVLLAKNSDSVTPLYIAIETDKVEVVSAVMALTDVDILREMFSYKSNTGDTVLYAANNRNVEEVKKAVYKKAVSHTELLSTLTILDGYGVSALKNLALTEKKLFKEILQTAKDNKLLKDLLALEVDGLNLLAMARDEAAAAVDAAKKAELDGVISIIEWNLGVGSNAVEVEAATKLIQTEEETVKLFSLFTQDVSIAKQFLISHPYLPVANPLANPFGQSTCIKDWDMDRIFLQESLQNNDLKQKLTSSLNLKQCNSNTDYAILPKLHYVWYSSGQYTAEQQKENFWKHNKFLEKNVKSTPQWDHSLWTNNKDYIDPEIRLKLQELGVSLNTLEELNLDEEKQKKLAVISYQFAEQKSFGVTTDLARYIVMFKEGGVYIDGDYELHNVPGLERLMCSYNSFFGVERGYDIRLGNGFLAAKADNKVIEEVMDLSYRNIFNNIESPDYIKYPCTNIMKVIHTTGPIALSLAFTKAAQPAEDLLLPYGYLNIFPSDKNMLNPNDNQFCDNLHTWETHHKKPYDTHDMCLLVGNLATQEFTKSWQSGEIPYN
jgi:mannosyltransferase OCH1-like enzyme